MSARACPAVADDPGCAVPERVPPTLAEREPRLESRARLESWVVVDVTLIAAERVVERDGANQTGREMKIFPTVDRTPFESWT